MRSAVLGIVIAGSLVAAPVVLFALYGAWAEFQEARFYASRPILHAMWDARAARREGARAPGAEATLLRSFPLGSSRSSAVTALMAEGFNCQQSPLNTLTINCQLRAPSDVAYTHWIVDLYSKDENALSEASVVIGGISF